MSTYLQRTKALAAAFVLALAVALGLASTSQAYATGGGDSLIAGVTTQAVSAIDYSGDTFKLVKEDLENEFGMLSPKAGTLNVTTSLGKVSVAYEPSNLTVYAGFYLDADISDPTTWKEENFVKANEDGTYDYAISGAYCGKATPIAPVKKSDMTATTAAQYYLAIPAMDALPAVAVQGYFAATGIVSSASMAKAISDQGFVYADSQGNAYLLAEIENGSGKYDYLWKGLKADAPDPSNTEGMIKGIPVPAEPGYAGATWTDEAGNYGVKNATYKGLLFIIPLTGDDLVTGKVNFQIRRSPWTPLSNKDPDDAEKSSNAEKWMGSNDNTLSFRVGSLVAAPTSVPALPSIDDVIGVAANVAAVPANATADDLEAYLAGKNAYQKFAGLYSCTAEVIEGSSYSKYTDSNQVFMDVAMPEAEAILDAAIASIPDTVLPDGEYTFLASIPQGTSYGVNRSLIASGRIPSATLKSENGKMLLTIKLTSASYAHTYVGTPAEAAALEAAAIAAGKTADDVDEYIKPDSNNCITVPIDSLNKPIYLTWRSKSSKVWFVRGSLFSTFNVALTNAAALAADVDGILNDPLGKVDGDVTDKKFRVDPSLITEDDRAAIEAIQAKYDALTDAEKASFDALAVFNAYADEQPYGRVLEEAVWALDALKSVDNATTLANGDYAGQPTVTFDAGKGATNKNAWALTALTIKDGKTLATVENTTGAYKKVKVGGEEYANKAAAGANPQFEIPVDLNATTTLIAFYDAKSSTNVAYETSTAIQVKVELDESTATPNKGASKIELAAPKAVTYSGKAVAYSGKVTKSGSTGKVTYAYYSDKNCKKAVKAANVKNAGTYYVRATLAGDANFNGATSAAVKLTINKAKNTLKAKAVKAKQNVKAGKSLTAKKAFKVTKNVSKGAVSYKKASGNKKITVSSKGKITVKKGLKKGKYPIKVKLSSKATANYKAGSATVKLTIVVK